MSKVYIGIDLAARCCWGVTLDQGGQLISMERFLTSGENLVAYVKGQPGEATVLMEECDLAGWALRVLLPHAEKVAVCEPRTNLWIHRDAVKTDKIDARKLAQIAMSGNYKEVWHTRDQEIYKLQMAVRAYERLSRRTTALKNQIKSELRGVGLITEGAWVFGKRGRRDILALVVDPVVRAIIASDYELLDFTLKRQAEAKGRFVRLGRQIGICRAFEEIPGVGPVVAAKFCAYVKCPQRFAKKGELFRYSRLGVSRRETGGKRVRGEHLDPSGCGALKDISHKAFRAALRTRGDNLIKRSYARTLASTGCEAHARLTTQRKILAIMWAMWKHGELYDDNRDLKERACEARL
ncbi:MAG: transposase [Actinobacteria bacterium]|nr:transposase [Actinomycetota bacterium]